MERRNFLKLLGAAGCAVAGGAALANLDKLESLRHQGEYRVSMSRAAIGTHVDITAFGPSQYETEDAVAAAFADVADMERQLTRYGNLSPVAELNAEGHIEHLPAPMAALLASCMQFYRATGGAFDITVKPILDRLANHAAPSSSELENILAHVGSDKLILQGQSLSIPEGMGITFDGCAPGFIADRAADILAHHGIQNFLVNAGGEIRTSGRPEEGKAWRIAIQDPQKRGNYPGYLAMHQNAVSTSGNYEIFFSEDRLSHHIIDAHTGNSPKHATSVTVTAPTALEADILSTALFVMSPAEALAFTAAHPQYACLIIANDGSITASPNFELA